MKGFLALLLIVLLAACAHNWWQIRTMQQDLARIEQKLDEQPADVMTEVVTQAVRAVALARDALKNTDTDRARRALEGAQKSLEDATRAATKTAGPMLDQLKRQVADMNREVQKRLGR